MKFTKLLTALLSLLLAATIHAKALPKSEIGHELVSRNPTEFGNVQVFISPHTNGGRKVRLLGGFRMTGPLLNIFINSRNRGAEMASSMYNQFWRFYLKESVTSTLIEQWWGLYKESTGGDQEANLGVQFITYGESDDTILTIIRHYFRDNSACSVLYQAVSDAWNIGGPFVQAPPASSIGWDPHDKKRDLLERQDGLCRSVDWVSVCRTDVTWDPDADLFGLTCATN